MIWRLKHLLCTEPDRMEESWLPKFVQVQLAIPEFLISTDPGKGFPEKKRFAKSVCVCVCVCCQKVSWDKQIYLHSRYFWWWFFLFPSGGIRTIFFPWRKNALGLFSRCFTIGPQSMFYPRLLDADIPWNEQFDPWKMDGLKTRNAFLLGPIWPIFKG